MIMEKEEEGGISLKEVFQIIGKRIWLVLGGAVIVALIAVLIFALAVNPLKSKSSLSFRMRYPMSDSEKYPDGSPFYSGDFTAAGLLKDDEKYASCDLAKMVKQEKLTVSVKTDAQKASVYTITVKNSAVSGKTEDFLKALVSAVENKIKDNATSVDYTIGTDVFNEASFAERLTMLDSQKKELVACYNSWIAEYSSAKKVGGKTLGAYLSEASAAYGDSTRASLASSLTLYGLDKIDVNEFMGDGGEVDYQAVRERLADELILTLKTLKTLKEYENVGGGNGGGSTVIKNPDGSTTTVVTADDLSQTIASYVKRSEEIKYQIGEDYVNPTTFEKNASAADGVLTKANVDKFNAQISARYEALQAAARTLNTVTATVYGTDTFAEYETEKVTTTGDTNVILIAAVVFVLSFLVLTLCAYLLGKKQVKKSVPVRETEEE